MYDNVSSASPRPPLQVSANNSETNDLTLLSVTPTSEAAHVLLRTGRPVRRKPRHHTAQHRRPHHRQARHPGQLATNNKATVVLLQETHKENDTILKLHGYTLAGQTKSRHHGLASRPTMADAVLLFNLKEPHSFISGCWNTETNPDLAFAKVIRQEPLPVRRILDRFPYSQHRPSLITTPSLVQSVEGKPVRRWNFRKANWSEFTSSTNTAAKSLPVPSVSNINDAYVAYCTMLTNTTKKQVPRGVQKNYVPCWDKECEELLQAHNEAKTTAERARAATELMTRLNSKRRERGGPRLSNQLTSPTPAHEHGRPSINKNQSRAPSLLTPLQRS